MCSLFVHPSIYFFDTVLLHTAGNKITNSGLTHLGGSYTSLTDEQTGGSEESRTFPGDTAVAGEMDVEQVSHP